MIGQEKWQSRTYPLVIHGDAAQFTNKKQRFSFESSVEILDRIWLWCEYFPLWCLVKTVCVEETVQVLYATTRNSFDALLDGIHPVRDAWGHDWTDGTSDAAVAGSLVADGCMFVVWVITGDLDFLSNDLGYPHFNGNYPCWFDSVSREPGTIYPITDLSRNAAWKETLLTQDESCVPCTENPMGNIDGTCRHTTPGDLMHTGCLGVLLYFLGGVMWQLVVHGPFCRQRECENDCTVQFD